MCNLLNCQNRLTGTVGSLLAMLTCALGFRYCRAEDWPQWRGPARDGRSQETGLRKQWPKGGPPLLWKAAGLGRGYSSVVVADGKIFTQGDRGGAEYLTALNGENGKRLWSARLGRPWTDGGSRSTPTVDGEHVYALSPHGDLVCVRTADGKVVWRKNLAKNFGGRMMSSWGYSESPLVDGDRLICTPGGDRAALVALNKQTGKVIWRAAVPNSGGAGYASVVIAEVGGIRQYLTLLGKSGGLVGVRAENGKLLWQHTRVAGGSANIPTPIVRGDLVFYSTGYSDGGSALLRLVPAGHGIKVKEVYVRSAGALRNHHGGMVLVGDYLYGGHGQNNGLPFCLEFKTGKERWGKPRGAGTGSAAVLYADGNLYFRYENGVMALVAADPRAYHLKSKFKIPDGSTPGWAHPVIANRRLYLRDQDRLLCFDVQDPNQKNAQAAARP